MTTMTNLIPLSDFQGGDIFDEMFAFVDRTSEPAEETTETDPLEILRNMDYNTQLAHEFEVKKLIDFVFAQVEKFNFEKVSPQYGIAFMVAMSKAGEEILRDNRVLFGANYLCEAIEISSIFEQPEITQALAQYAGLLCYVVGEVPLTLTEFQPLDQLSPATYLSDSARRGVVKLVALESAACCQGFCG